MNATKRRLLAPWITLAMVMSLLPAALGTSPAQAATGDLIITGVIDGPLSGGIPKAIELFVVNDIVDLSVYGVGSANNGGGTDGQEFTFPAGGATAGDFIYVASEAIGFGIFFGFAPDHTSGAVNINGDDAIELFMNGAVVDVFGDIGASGPGQPWEYLDGWAYRVDGTGQDGSTFVLANWTFSGKDALDGATTNASATTPFPIGTYAAGPITGITMDCGAGIVVDQGTSATTTVTASDPDDAIVSMTVADGGGAPVTAGTFAGAVAGGTASLVVDLADTAGIGTYVVTVGASNDGGDAATCMFAIEVESAEVVITPIHAIQGPGTSSPLDGSVVTVEAIVVADFQDGDLNGFNLQEEDHDADADPQTSEGIFVFEGGNTVDVMVGDLVQVTGEVDEFFGLTQLMNITAVTVISTGNPLPTPVAIDLPVDTLDRWETWEGMSVSFPQQLSVTDNFEWARFGSVLLSSGGPLDNPTNVVAPGPAAEALQDENDRNRIQLADGSNATNLASPPWIQPDGTLRRGDTVDDLAGVLLFAFGDYEVVPTGDVTFERVNDRLGPPDVGGDLTVAAFNVLNFYTTIDQPGAMCFPSNTRSDCRGADTVAEYELQRAKIVAAISELDADVVGLMEIENNGDTAVADLVDGLNDAVGAGTYDYVAAGTTGTDTIKVAMIYQPGAVTPVGGPAILDSPDFLDPADTGVDRNRAALAQSFADNATGDVFTVAVNHLKSKGGSEIDDRGAICVDGDPSNDIPDCDQGDGQAYFNHTRTLAAEALADWLASDPTGSGDPDALIVGDLNAYAMEDPVAALEGSGWTDLIESFQGTEYSFVFFGQSGYLDHGLASPAILPKVTGADFWHINADEPTGLDYNNFNSPALQKPDEWRSSDHDPVVIGLAPEATALRDRKQAVLDQLEGIADDKAIAALEASLAEDLWADGNHLTEDGAAVFGHEQKAVKELGKTGGLAADAAIAELVAIDQGLAQRLIDIAIATGGDQHDIDKALAEMAKAADLAAGSPAEAIDKYRLAWMHASKAIDDVRFATFNASLNRFNAGDLAAELATPGSAQPATIAEIIQRSRPDVVLINEFDYDAAGLAAIRFQRNYLSIGQGGADPIEYPFRYVAPSNTGVPSGFDLDNNGVVGGPNDAFGFGFFPGQFGMVVYSMLPLDESEIRTFQNFLWKDMPGALLPDDPLTAAPADWYSAEELDVFRLSSKSHWDVPVVAGEETIHFLTSHPTPPVFDGPEDRNGTRNHDEIRFWADYVEGASYIYDDAGVYGGLGGGARFVIAGDQNADPFDGDSIPGAIQQLLDHPKVNDESTPSSLGAVEQAALQGGANTGHISDPAFDTADFSDRAPGNLRVDYVLPSKNMKITDSAVFWPLTSDPLFALVGTFPFPSSDHRLVWIDVRP